MIQFLTTYRINTKKRQIFRIEKNLKKIKEIETVKVSQKTRFGGGRREAKLQKTEFNQQRPV